MDHPRELSAPLTATTPSAFGLACTAIERGSGDTQTASGGEHAPKARNGEALSTFLEQVRQLPANALARAAELAGTSIGASSTRLLVADYGLLSLQELGPDGPTGPPIAIEGSLAGRAFERGDVVVVDGDPTRVWVPLAEGSERLGVLELTHEAWSDDTRSELDGIIALLVLVLISRRRYTDTVVRARRSEALSLAAEMQWDLLPPLTCSTPRVTVSGILEPAYSIGGDSFDYALNRDHVQFSIIDAVGHGMPAVMMSITAINGLRNARRERRALDAAYRDTGVVIDEQFGRCNYVTGQFGDLDLESGVLTWLNAGHPLPLLVRDAAHVDELRCPPSLPMGLGGSVAGIATEKLQPGDRLLFYTDGVTETRSSAGEPFGVPRLADYLVRASGEGSAANETVRRLSALIVGYNNGIDLTDDATLLLIEYHG